MGWPKFSSANDPGTQEGVHFLKGVPLICVPRSQKVIRRLGMCCLDFAVSVLFMSWTKVFANILAVKSDGFLETRAPPPA